MLGPGIGSVFASRWKALWWSAAVLLTAYCTVPSAEESKQSNASQNEDVRAAQEAAKAIEQLNSGGGESE